MPKNKPTTKTNKKTQKRAKMNKTELKDLILNYIYRVGVGNINYSHIARESGWGRKTIKRYVERMLEDIPQEELLQERAKAYYDYLGMEKIAGGLMEDEIVKLDPRLKLKVLKARRELWESKAKVWEDFRLKERVAQPLEFEFRILKPDDEEE